MESTISRRQFLGGALAGVFIPTVSLPWGRLEDRDESMKISSPAFKNGEMMPEIYTSESDNISPPLKISGVPKNTVSLVLLSTDPDVPNAEHPTRTVIHWVVVNLPPDTKELPAGVKIASIPGAMEGLNEHGLPAYTGPRPPTGTHRYYFRLYALDTKLSFNQPPTEAQVKEAMKGHIIAEAETMGRYSLKKNREPEKA